ncbi:MAG: hypothetical protein M1832_005536 [Thelocarpon impressellum]|nr:MAG: hypothetical protein M1832_005536 [Thelocarpon impressellum]
MRLAALSSGFLLSLSTLLFVPVGGAQLVARQSCQTGYQSCSPSGEQTTSVPPQIGGALSLLYVELVDSVAGVKLPTRDVGSVVARLGAREQAKPICCVEGTQCLLVHELDVPFCYDPYTTNYYLPDGSYGSIVGGDYNAPDGSKANLLTGDYHLQNGTSGNVYAGHESDKPNTATLTLPKPYTSAGVGSAIAASALGALKTFTTTVPGTTVEATTIPASTIAATRVSGTDVPASTVAASTIGGTTVAPLTTVMTSGITAAESATATADKPTMASGARSLVAGDWAAAVCLVLWLAAL